MLTNNCNSCAIYHDLGMRFNLRFVNLWMSPKNSIKYLENLEYYNFLDSVFINQLEYEHSVGMIGDLQVYFTHYHTNEEANAKR